MGSRTLQLYSPHEFQLKFHQSKSRYRVAAAGRQVGKSTMAMNELIRHAWEKPNTHYWFISPVFAQAKDQYRKAVRYLPMNAINKTSDTELKISLINESSITYRSGEVLDRLRGATLNGVILDEVRDLNSDLWPLVIRPMLSTTKGWAAFISTPSGFDAFYDLYQMPLSDSDWERFSGPSTCNPLFTQEEFEAAKKEMSEGQFAQEIMAEFRDITSGKAYLNHGPWNQLEQCPWGSTPGTNLNPYLPVLVACDFNLSPMSWTLGQTKIGDFYFFDEIHLKNSHTQEATKELIERVRFHKPGVVICGDATAKAGQRAAAGQSDYAILCQGLKEAGIKFENRTPDSNPHVKDRVNTVNAKLKAADGSVHVWYNPKKCPNLKRDFERVVWKKGASAILDQTTNPDLTHSSDGVGYAICELTQMWQPSPGLLRIIPR